MSKVRYEVVLVSNDVGQSTKKVTAYVLSGQSMQLVKALKAVKTTQGVGYAQLAKLTKINKDTLYVLVNRLRKSGLLVVEKDKAAVQTGERLVKLGSDVDFPRTVKYVG